MSNSLITRSAIRTAVIRTAIAQGCTAAGFAIGRALHSYAKGEGPEFNTSTDYSPSDPSPSDPVKVPHHVFEEVEQAQEELRQREAAIAARHVESVQADILKAEGVSPHVNSIVAGLEPVTKKTAREAFHIARAILEESSSEGAEVMPRLRPGLPGSSEVQRTTALSEQIAQAHAVEPYELHDRHDRKLRAEVLRLSTYLQHYANIDQDVQERPAEFHERLMDFVHPYPVTKKNVNEAIQAVRGGRKTFPRIDAPRSKVTGGGSGSLNSHSSGPRPDSDPDRLWQGELERWSQHYFGQNDS